MFQINFRPIFCAHRISIRAPLGPWKFLIVHACNADAKNRAMKKTTNQTVILEKLTPINIYSHFA
jgi:hypothetical protein